MSRKSCTELALQQDIMAYKQRLYSAACAKFQEQLTAEIFEALEQLAPELTRKLTLGEALRIAIHKGAK